MALCLVGLLAAGAVLLVPPAPASGAGQVKVLVAGKRPTSLQDLQEMAGHARRAMKRVAEQMREVTARYEAARARLDGVNQVLVQTRLQLAATQSELDSREALVGARLAAMYKMGEYGWLEFLVDAEALGDPETQVAFFRLIAEQDRRDQIELERLGVEVQRLEATIAARREDGLEAQAAIDAERALMAQKLAERRQILGDLLDRIEKLLALPNGLAAATAGGAYNPVSWARALLLTLGMPVTPDNLAAITAWEMAEGGHWHNSAHYNPLNTTQSEPGATAMNSVGVKAYTSWAQGFHATVETLHNGRYEGILAALRAGNDAQGVIAAVAASPWGTGAFSVELSPLR